MMEEICSQDIDHLSGRELNKIIKSSIFSRRKEYDAIAEASGIPKIFIDKYNASRLTFCEELFSVMEKICLSDDIIKGNRLTLLRIMDMFYIIFFTALIHIKTEMANINGELSCLKYNNKEIGNCPDNCDVLHKKTIHE